MEMSGILTLATPQHAVAAEPLAAPFDRDQAPSAPVGFLTPLLRVYRWRILATYLLFNLENLVRLAQPWFLGWAVNDLLAGRTTGLVLCAAQHLLSLAMCIVRQVYDTRTFTRLYADLATRLVVEQRRGGVDISRLAAHSSLSREAVDFFERDVPFLFHAIYSVAGALVMIALFDFMLMVPCLLFLGMAGLLTLSLARRTLHLNRGLNDQIEHEVSILQDAAPDRVEDHYHKLRGWRIQLCNAQSLNLGMTEMLALFLMGFVLVRGCTSRTIDAGTLFALLGYVVMLTNSLVNLPQWIQQLSRLCDIRRRLQDGTGA
jgi:ABC-type multidrug transport system fused ATPase/permease subunit